MPPSRSLPLTEDLKPYLRKQKRAILRALQSPPSFDEGNPNASTLDDLTELLRGTIDHAQGNICLLLGPKGSGKTHLLQNALDSLPGNPIVLRLSGHAQLTDRNAVRETARQLSMQTDRMVDIDVDQQEDAEEHVAMGSLLPPPAHILTLVSSLTSLSRPTIVVLDAFDLFASHARQALLYCLFDTAQNCRAAAGSKGLAIIGVTSRVDCINLLEKRVKSRFSHRTLRVRPISDVNTWLGLARRMLMTPVEGSGPSHTSWKNVWSTSVERFLADRQVKTTLSDAFAISRDAKLLSRILLTPVLELSDESPYLQAAQLSESLSAQQCRTRFPFLPSLSYPALGLIIAASHWRSADHDVFTFEMLHDRFASEIRTSSAAPVRVAGQSIGMQPCKRNVMLGAFESVVSARIFQPATPPSTTSAKEFAKYRCVLTRDEIKAAVYASGNTSLKRYLTKAHT